MSGIVKTIQVPGNKLPILPTEIWQMIAEALVNAIFSDFKYLHFSRNDPSEISPMRLEYEDDRILFQRLNQTRLINRQFNRMIGQTHVVRSIFARISALNHLPCIDSVGYNIAAGEWELVISANICKKGLTDSQMMNANTDIAYLLVGLLLLKKSHYFDVIIVHSDDRRHLLPLLSAILKNWIGYNTGRKIYVHELWLDASIEQSDGTGFNAINEFQQTALALSAYPHECPEEFHAVLCDECRRIQFNFSQIPRNTMFCDLCASTEAFSVAGNSSTVAANSAYYSVINDDDNSDVVDMGKIEDLLVLLQFRSLL